MIISRVTYPLLNFEIKELKCNHQGKNNSNIYTLKANILLGDPSLKSFILYF